MLDDNIVHPKRIVIMTVLFIFREMTEGDLSKATGIDWGSLTTHLTRLERNGYIERKKVITNKGLRTIVRITDTGYRTYKEEIEKLKNLIKKTEW
jgi:DNA-binding MarR family transcriptional regulator